MQRGFNKGINKGILGFTVLVLCLCFNSVGFARTESSSVKDLGYVTGAEYEKVMSRYYSVLNSDCTSTKSTNIYKPFKYVDIGVIINIGKVLWAIVQNGQSVFQEKIDNASALPQGTKCWNELSGWSRPVVKKFSYKFFSGTSYTKLVLGVVAITGGSKSGKGKFIGYASAYTDELKNYGVMNQLNVSVTVPSVFNEGEEGNPVAGMLMNLKVQNKGKIVDRIEGKNVYINGKGSIELVQ